MAKGDQGKSSGAGGALAQTRPDGRLRKHEAKATLLKLAADGIGPSEAMRSLGFSVQTYEGWRREDRSWAEQMSTTLRLARIRLGSGRSVEVQRPEVGFAEFSERYLKARVWPHSMNVVDLLEGRDPSWLHPAMTWLPAERDLLIVNMPPEHAKTQAFTINYTTYRLATQPNLRVLIVSKTTQMAQKMLFAIKERLTGPNFSDLIEDWAPRGGFAGNSGKWTQDTIYLNPEVRNSGEKDPSVQALGIGSHIYGARADMIILDDVVDSLNAHDYERQMEWIQSQVLSRLSPSGVLLMVGTRLAARDLYTEIQNPDLYPDSTCPWSYLAMPAVLETAESPRDWVTLWPRTDVADVGDRSAVADADGLFPKWDGVQLNRRRARMTPNLWARVYQQAQVTEDTVFPPEDVRGCVNGARNVGLIPRGKAGVRENGMAGLTVVAGLDPATAGFTSMCVIGLDTRTQRRHVLDGFNKSGCLPDDIRGNIFRLTDKYGVVEWVIETNGFQGFLAQDREVMQFLSSRGALVRPHHTGTNKIDPNFGVSAMAGLFKNWREGQNLIELPSTHASEALKALVEQLMLWAPDDRTRRQPKSDMVMALWMAELACRRRLDMVSGYTRRHGASPFLTRADVARQVTVDFSDVEVFDRLVTR